MSRYYLESDLVKCRSFDVAIKVKENPTRTCLTGGLPMFAKIKHMAIVSDDYAMLGKFYEAAFRMNTSRSARAESAVVLGDGYVGLNINPRRAGRQASLDHFGFEVEDVQTVFARLRDKYPAVRVLKRPSNRPFAGLSTHDPAGNVLWSNSFLGF